MVLLCCRDEDGIDVASDYLVPTGEQCRADSPRPTSGVEYSRVARKDSIEKSCFTFEIGALGRKRSKSTYVPF